MRILDNSRREEILGYLETSFSNLSINPFLFDTTYAIIASGEEEATFDWLGVNYLYNRLINNDSDMSTLGALDLGGQSTQIAFTPDPNSNILADFTAVRLWEITHRLYTHSFLQYGTNAIRDRIAQLSYNEWINSNLSKSNVTNPCLNNGANDTFKIQNESGIIFESQQFGNAKDNLFKCRSMMRTLLANDTTCYVEDCAFNGVYLAEIPQNMTFIAFSAFGYAISGLNISSTINLDELFNVILDVCNMTLTELRESKYHNKYSDGYLDTYCRLTNYIYVLLYDGYGFKLKNTNIIFTNNGPNDKTITWTQGSILRDSNWLPYDLKYINNNDDQLTNQGKMWRTLTITLITVLVVVMIGCLFLIYKLKKHTTSTYRNMEM